MKYRLKVDGRWFEVEVESVDQRPILAVVDGEPLEVWPEDKGVANQPEEPGEGDTSTSIPMKSQIESRPALWEVRAPIPGTIVSIAVNPGDQVAYGDELCVLEAMKMKNKIRSTRAGTIGAVRVAINQTVQHGQVLFEFQG